MKFDDTAGDILSLFAGTEYSSQHSLVDYRVKKFAYACVQAVHQNRFVTAYC